MTSLLVMNGPNLNLLGQRQPDVYGTATLADVESRCTEAANELGCAVSFFQSNHEGALIDQMHAARGTHGGVILNAGGLTHTSIALMDAIASSEVPTIELHISNVHARESFRHKSCLAPAVIGIISGFGINGYVLAMRAMRDHLAANG